VNQGVAPSSPDNRLSEVAICIQQVPTSNIDPETNNELRPFVVYSAPLCKHRNRRHIKSVYDSSSNFLSISLFILTVLLKYVPRDVECIVNRREVSLCRIMGQYFLTHFFFHSCTVHFDVIKSFICPTNAHLNCFKILKIYIKIYNKCSYMFRFN